MKIPLKIAQNLALLYEGEMIADSTARHPIIDSLVEENIIARNGRIKKTLVLQNKVALDIYLENHFGIANLAYYIEALEKENISRAELVFVSSDSKLKSIRSFKGFLANSYQPLHCMLNNETFTLSPQEGTFTFIYDFESFIPEADITIVGIENPENFRKIHLQKHLFNHLKPLFVSRYPQNQSKDLIKWLSAIPNDYLHFGDYDLAGINIYINEFKKYRPDKSSFFIPKNIDALLYKYGNKDRYNDQKEAFDRVIISEELGLLILLNHIHNYKKGLDQEVLIR